MSLCLSAFLFAVLSVGASAQHGGDFTPRRVSFAKGRTTAVLKGVVKGAKGYVYKLRARGGQTMSVHIAGRANFTVNQESGDALAADVKDWSGELPQTGEYSIFVSGVNGDDSVNRPFTLEITIR
jgi:hypothetical protein